MRKNTDHLFTALPQSHTLDSSGFSILCICEITLFERACGLENENETFFVELWHVCDTKRCVKEFGGGKIKKFTLGLYHMLMLIQ